LPNDNQDFLPVLVRNNIIEGEIDFLTLYLDHHIQNFTSMQ